MRNSYLFLLVTIFTCTMMSAQVKIGDNPQNINPSSVLELESTDKVLVITRVTTVQMNAIVPSQGALCFNTDLQSVHYYNGTQWVNVGGGSGTGGPLTADPIVNTQPTIVITPTATGDNLEVAPNSIRSEQIVDGGVNGVDIQDGSIGPGKLQDFSITQEKLSENSVGAFALDNDSFGVSAFNNDAGYITAADINLVSGDVGNVLENRTDGVFYNDQPLITAINQNTDAIALDDDQSAANEIQNLQLVGNELTISGSNTVTLPSATGEIDDNELITDAVLNGTDLIITEAGADFTVPLGSLSGGGGSTEEADQTTITGVGTNADPFKIEPGATGQILTTDATGVVWANAAPGSGSTEEADQITITGVGTNADPFKIEPGAAGQILSTSAAGVVWANAAPGTGSTEEADQITITGVGTNADPFKIEPGADGQVLITSGTAVTWAAPTGSGSTEEADQTTITGVGTNADPFKIEPGTAGQFLTTDATGVVWTTVTPGGGTTEEVDGTTLTGLGTSANPFKLGQNGATDGQILKWDDATTSWITAADDSGTAALNDGNIYIGDATNTPQGVPLSGDATIDNTGALTIADDAITLAKINQNGATDGQIMKWDDATTSWVLAADDTGTVALTDGNIFVGNATNTPQGVTLSGDATINNTGTITIADDAVTSNKIENATILAEDLNAMGATADGEILQWNTALNAGAGGWEVATNNGHTGPANHIFFADATTNLPVTDPLGGLIWNPTAINNAFPALGIGLDGVGVQSAKAKVHIMENYPLSGEISYGIQLQNRSQTINTAVGMIFSVDDWTTSYGKGALVFERTGAWAVGDFHFLQNNATGAGTDVNPTLADKAFTITSDKDVRLYRGIDINGVGLGTAGQILASGGVGNPVQWVNAVGSGDNLSTANLVQPATSLVRTYNMPNANQSLVFTGLGNVGIGNGANPPQSKFHVAGEIRVEGIKSSDGTESNPAFTFTNDTNGDTGIYRPNADEIGFSVGGHEALRIDEPTTGNTNVIINQSLELDGTLIDTGGQVGTAGQVLTSTATGVDWKTPRVRGIGKIDSDGSTLKFDSGFGINNDAAPGSYQITMQAGLLSNADYVVQLTVEGDNIIYVENTTITSFDVKVISRVSGNPTNAAFHYTVLE